MARSRSIRTAAAAVAAALALAAPAAGDAAGEATCPPGVTGAAETVRAADAVLGPLVLIGGNGWGRSRRDAFGGRGFKIPATLSHGAVATLSVPPLADAAVRFTACPGEPPGRTGWAGGIVLDRPRCATVVVRVPGADPVRRRLPLGRRC